MKICSACKIEKELSLYGKDKHSFDGLTSACKSCRKLSMAAWTARNKSYYKQKHKEWKEKNPIEWAAHKKKDYLKHREKRLATDKKRKQATHYSARYEFSRKKTDVVFKLRLALRKRIQKAIRNNQKAGSAVSDLGCSVPHLKLHLELFWDEGMSWDNYGYGEDKWNIDHTIPLSSFNLAERSQFLKACHYTNLQPMWQKDNFMKSNKVVQC